MMQVRLPNIAKCSNSGQRCLILAEDFLQTSHHDLTLGRAINIQRVANVKVSWYISDRLALRIGIVNTADAFSASDTPL